MPTPDFDVAYDRALVEVLACERSTTELRFRAHGASQSFLVPVVLVPGPFGARIADTVSAAHIPYATARLCPGALDGAPVTLASGEAVEVDLVRLRAVRADDPLLTGLTDARVRRVLRDEAFSLALESTADDPFRHAASGDARRWRALMRDDGVQIVEADGAQNRRAAAREIVVMFSARAHTQGIAGREKLAEVEAMAIAERSVSSQGKLSTAWSGAASIAVQSQSARLRASSRSSPSTACGGTGSRHMISVLGKRPRNCSCAIAA
jgi:hypothetical protein